jgi:hypothetical protein
MILCASLVTRSIKLFRLERCLCHLNISHYLKCITAKDPCHVQHGGDLHSPRTDWRKAKRMLDASRHECMSRVLGNLCESPQAKLFKTTNSICGTNGLPVGNSLLDFLEHIRMPEHRLSNIKVKERFDICLAWSLTFLQFSPNVQNGKHYQLHG